MRVTMLLADSAQALGGKLYILGGGWTQMGPTPVPFAIAMKFEVPWDQANRRHQWTLRLLDEDGRPVRLPARGGEEKALEMSGAFEVGRPPGLVPGSPLDFPLVIQFGPLPLPSRRRLEWVLEVDGHSEPYWRAAFGTSPAPASN